MWFYGVFFFISVIWVYNVVATTKEVTIKSGGVLNIHHNSFFYYSALSPCYSRSQYMIYWQIVLRSSSIPLSSQWILWIEVYRLLLFSFRHSIGTRWEYGRGDCCVCVSVCSIFHLVDDRICTHTNKKFNKTDDRHYFQLYIKRNFNQSLLLIFPTVKNRARAGQSWMKSTHFRQTRTTSWFNLIHTIDEDTLIDCCSLLLH